MQWNGQHHTQQGLHDGVGDMGPGRRGIPQCQAEKRHHAQPSPADKLHQPELVSTIVVNRAATVSKRFEDRLVNSLSPFSFGR